MSSFFIQIMTFLATLIALSMTQEHRDDDFCYQGEECGPQRWGGDCQTGSHQSPIDISGVFGLPTKVALHFNTPGYSSTTPTSGFWIRNNGHTIQVSLNQELTSEGRMWGYGMDPRGYIFAQIHFHWGQDDQNGSEHTIDGRHYGVEVHLVHYDAKYSSFAEAANSGDPKGLAVLAVFLTTGIESDENDAFDLISNHIPMQYEETAKHIPNVSLDLSTLLPHDGASFYRYVGSLTTPNCTEAVDWTVMKEPIRVKPSEIERLHAILDHHGEPMGLNYRPTQPIGDRVIEYLATGGGVDQNFDDRSKEAGSGEESMTAKSVSILPLFLTIPFLSLVKIMI